MGPWWFSVLWMLTRTNVARELEAERALREEAGLSAGYKGLAAPHALLKRCFTLHKQSFATYYQDMYQWNWR